MYLYVLPQLRGNTSTNNDGAYTDATNYKGGGVYNYAICEAGTTNCSATVTVVF
ncbi:hypothetical protein WCN91_12510 [Pseudoalteromonas sp. YIC-827]|uniref:Uncharacterized protein n=1 Tax=Pseudoalteromonas qingdaonensis TaxID=3131913 RepID=A0ABU9MZ19_9GAMM